MLFDKRFVDRVLAEGPYEPPGVFRIGPRARVGRVLKNPAAYEYEFMHDDDMSLRLRTVQWQPRRVCPACKGLGRVFTFEHRYYIPAHDQFPAFGQNIMLIKECPICHNLGLPIQLNAPGLVLQLGTKDGRPLVAIKEDFAIG